MRIRSPAAKATSVKLPIQVISVAAIESNSTPSSNGEPVSCVIVGVPGVYLYILYRPPALSLALDSLNQPEKSDVVRVSPVPTGGEIHAIVEPPAVLVHWMSVPPAVRVTTAVSAPEPAVFERSYTIPSPVSVTPLVVVLRRYSLVAIDYFGHFGRHLGAYHRPTLRK